MPSSRNPGMATISTHPAPPPYHIYEPHPTPSTRRPPSSTTTTYMHSGRGGAGNVVKLPPTSLTSGPNARGPASLARLPSTSSSNVQRTGRGGAGNIVEGGEKRMFSFDEELQAQLARERRVAPIYHVGRGGAGNLGSNERVKVYLDGSSRTRRGSDSASDASMSSGGSAAREIRRGVKKGWKKLGVVGDYMVG